MNKIILAVFLSLLMTGFTYSMELDNPNKSEEDTLKRVADDKPVGKRKKDVYKPDLEVGSSETQEYESSSGEGVSEEYIIGWPSFESKINGSTIDSKEELERIQNFLEENDRILDSKEVNQSSVVNFLADKDNKFMNRSRKIFDNKIDFFILDNEEEFLDSEYDSTYLKYDSTYLNRAWNTITVKNLFGIRAEKDYVCILL